MRPEFFDAIARAKQRIENYAEEKLFDPAAPIHGVKFSLSNNHHGWKDKSETDLAFIKKHPAQELAEELLAGVSSGADAATDPQADEQAEGTAE